MIQKGILSTAVFVMVFIAFMIVYSDNGIKDLFSLYREEQQIVLENKRLEARNRTLAKKVIRLKKDLDYIEHIARHRLGMAKRDELVIKFK